MIADHGQDSPARAVWENIYFGKVNLWVEDELTEQLLRRLWVDLDINILPAGGRDAVSQLVHRTTPPAHQQRVFGLIDRDFAPDNDGAWQQAATRQFIWPVHEVENLLLDLDLLVELSAAPKPTAQALRTELHDEATRCRFWLAYRAVTEQLWRERGEVQFERPARPSGSAGIGSRDAALSLLGIGSTPSYWSQLREWQAKWDAAALEQSFDQHLAQYEQDLRSDSWLQTFPGKELLTRARVAMKWGGNNQDFAFRIADRMRQEPARIPDAVKRLHKTLRQRAGLPEKSLDS